MQVFHLPHDVLCRDQCACAEVTVVVVAENPRTGERAPKHLNKKVPGSLTFLALERKPGLPSAVLELAQVKAAIGRGYLRVIEQTPEALATPPVADAAAASLAHSPGPAVIGLLHQPAPTTQSAPPSPAQAASASAPPPVPPVPPPTPTPAPAPTPAAKPAGKEA
jgi:hypothetical protein